MNIQDYLQSRFLSEEQLLTAAECTLLQLQQWQAARMAPQPSYYVSFSLNCRSVLAEHQQHRQVRYYATATADWLRLLTKHNNAEAAFGHFKAQYKKRLQALNVLGVSTSDRRFNHGLDAHIQQEWQHFLQGTYGLCTQTGRIAEIVDKELAIAVIDELSANVNLPDSDRLKQAKVLLDKACASFPEHEYPGSSRQKYLHPEFTT